MPETNSEGSDAEAEADDVEQVEEAPTEEKQGEEEAKPTDLSDSDVVTKYKLAAGIANKTLTGLLGFCKPGMKVVTACAFGDTLIDRQCQTMYKSKKVEKGIAFPTCVSLNEDVCHYSPFESESDVMKENDMVKIDIGVHIDGYIAVLAHTFVLKGSDPSSKSQGESKTEETEVKKSDKEEESKVADVVVAAYTALEAASKLMKPGAKNSDISDIIQKVADCYDVKLVQGVLMHQMKRFVIDGNNVILQKPSPEQRVEPFEFEPFQVYTLDIVMATAPSEGKPVMKEKKTMVFKRMVDQTYRLKMKASRSVYNEIIKKFSTMPFGLRALVQGGLDENIVKLGISECIKHDLVHSYPVLIDKHGSKICDVKATMLMLQSGTVNATKMPIMELSAIKSSFKSEKKVSEEIESVLKTSTKSSKKKKKKAKTPTQTDE